MSFAAAPAADSPVMIATTMASAFSHVRFIARFPVRVGSLHHLAHHRGHALANEAVQLLRMGANDRDHRGIVAGLGHGDALRRRFQLTLVVGAVREHRRVRSGSLLVSVTATPFGVASSLRW